MLMMGSVILSRVIGFFREMAIARTMGATAQTDVYYASFTIPEFLNYLVAAGALSISFIPMLSDYLATNNKELGNRVFRSLSTWLGLAILIFIIIAEIFAGQLGRLIAPGFSPEQQTTLTFLLRIILPAQFFFFWGGLAVAIQQTHGRFLLPALSPLLYNIGIIGGGLLLHRSYGIAGFSIGVLIGAIVSQGIVQWWGVHQLGYSVRPYFKFPPEIVHAIKRYLWLSLPIMLGFSLVVTDDWIAKYFASSLDKGALSWLAYARTEMRIPIAIIGQAAGIASFPYLARLWSNKNYEEYGTTLLREIKKLWVLAPLATILIINHAQPITHFIYGGGKLTPRDLAHTARALQIFGIGIFFWTAQILLARGFYACQITWIPSLIGTILSIVCIPLYRYLAIKMSYEGLALAGSIGIAIYTVLLWIMLQMHLRKYCPQLPLKNFFTFCAAWGAFLILMALISEGVYRLGIYRGTQFSALFDILVVLLATGPLAFLAQRTIFRRFTDAPLF
jgi:putative peptidoglycan lipid II flippase